jgi:hypothetical protein
MSSEISDLEARLQHLKDAVGGAVAGAVSAAAAVVRRGRKPGRPAGKRGPGRPPGSGTKRRGRPPAAAPAAAPAAGEGTAAKASKKGRKRAAITSEQLASRQLQGRYLALVRRFPAAKRAGFAKTAKEKGREAAIKEMQDSLPKK